MKTVLFVCTGNTCRSPMAAALFNRYAREHGLDAQADSAGLSVASGLTASPHAIEAMAELGEDLSQHRSKSVSKPMLDAADFLVCMTENHADVLNAAGYHPTVLGHGIPDPFGGSLDEYRRCRDVLNAAMATVAAHL